MQLSITLPDDLAARVRQRVASGAFADESEMVREALEEMEEKDLPFAEQVENWLRLEAVSAYDAHIADPSRSLSVDQARASLAAHRARTKKG